jgi:hypothetical protein
MASITIERDKRSGLLSLRDPAGKLRLEDYSRARMAIKLARDMRLPARKWALSWTATWSCLR